MVSRRRALYQFGAAILGAFVTSTTVSGQNGQTVLVTIENESNATLVLESNHSLASEVGEDLEIEVGESGAGAHPDGLTEFESFFEVTNDGGTDVHYGIETTSEDIGAGEAVDFTVGSDSLVVSPEDGPEISAGETVAVDFTLDFLDNDETNVEEEVTISYHNVEVSTGEAEENDESSVLLTGTVTELEGADSADVWFEYGEAGSGLPNVTPGQTVSSAEDFSESVDGLEEETTYEFRAVAEIAQDDDTGEVEVFETEAGGGCFITTATVGESDELDSLRRFRDDSMATTPLGRALVDLYYRISPPIAATLERHPESRTVRVGKHIVQWCATLSDAQARTQSCTLSVFAGVVLTVLYFVGILIAAWGHVVLQASERLGLSG